jgi:hypothetical protein
MLPRTWYRIYTDAAEWAARNGVQVLSGATPGAEQLAAQGALKAGGQVTLYLPWHGFEVEWVKCQQEEYPGQVTLRVYDPEIHAGWAEAIHRWHPAGTHLARASLALYARSYGLVYEATSVVALPFVRTRNGATDRGQSEQGLQIARELGLSLYDISDDELRERLRELIAS